MPKSVSIYEKEIILVYEYVPNGTLKDHLHVLRTPLSWIQRVNICTGAARALHYLHTRAGTETDTAIMHGDIKSSNILLTESWTPKVSDFGMSKIGPADEPSNSFVSLAKGSFGYWDHYSLSSGKLTRKSDVYSFGVMLLEVLCRKPALDESCDRSLVTWVQRSVKEGNLEDIIDSDMRNEVSSKCLKDFFEIAKRCLHEDPEQRPDMAEVVSSLESVLGDPSNRKGNTKFPEVLASLGPRVNEFTFNDLQKLQDGFGKVFLGWVEHNTLAPSEEGAGILVAVKRITSEIPRLYNEWLEEVNFLGQLVHPNIIRLLGCCNGDEHEQLLVYEHMNKSLSQFIHGAEPLSWGTRLQIMIGVARGLTYLYTVKGVLCHFQCNDILLDEDFNAKIGGFGWTEIQGRHDRKLLNGAFGYLKADDHDISYWLMKNDICSFGFVLLETITGRHLSDFEDVLVGLESLEMQSPKSKLNRRKLKKIMDPRLKGDYSREGAFKCMSLASRCIAIQPECRPSRAEILWSLEQIYDALNK